MYKHYLSNLLSLFIFFIHTFSLALYSLNQIVRLLLFYVRLLILYDYYYNM